MQQDRQIVRVRSFLPDVEGRNWVYPQSVKGRFTRFRGWFSIPLFALLFGTPFLRYDGLPAILFDIPNRRFIILGNVFWPHDLWLLIFLGIAGAVAIFLFTAMLGRVWCGYACPQSVFLTQVFLRIERFIEGDRNAQMRLDNGPWTAAKVRKKAVKHALFVAVSSIVAHTFLAYFMDVRDLSHAILHPSWEYKTPVLFATFFTGLFYLDFAFFREQFCTQLCPYARFQSALLDEDSLIVAYDPRRGEPRGNMKERRGRDEQYGDCIDCSKCVVVCPVGIDIRDGLQLDCIHCAKCIDACDSVMDKIERPRGLIRYASESELDKQPRRLLRPRTVAYSALLVAMVAVLAVLLSNRRLIEATLVRPPSEQLYSMTASGGVANHFRVQLINKDRSPKQIRLELVEPAGWELVTPQNPVDVPAGELRPVEVFVTVPAGAERPGGATGFRLRARDAANGETVTMKGSMILPRAGTGGAGQ